MLANLLGFVLLVLFTALLVWLSIKAWRARSRVVRWLGGTVSSLLALLFLLVTGITAVGLVKIYVPARLPAASVQVQGTPDQLARGEHLAMVLYADCHSENLTLPLSGSTRNMTDTFPLPLGSMHPANLTPGGDLKDWSDDDIFRAIRYNRSPDGRPLFMPAAAITHFSDEDVKSLIAYLRSQPAVANRPPETRPSLLMAVLVGANIFNVTPPLSAQPIIAPPKGPTAEYGKYVVGYFACQDCHGPTLEGGSPPAPVGPSLQVVKGWTQEQFIATMRTGVDPGGHQLSEDMPWKAVALLDDEEVAAMYSYLHELPGSSN